MILEVCQVSICGLDTPEEGSLKAGPSGFREQVYHIGPLVGKPIAFTRPDIRDFFNNSSLQPARQGPVLAKLTRNTRFPVPKVKFQASQSPK